MWASGFTAGACDALTTCTEHFDTLETRDPEARERAQFARLPQQIAHAKARAPAFAALLANVDPAAIDVARRARAPAGDAQVGAARPAEGIAPVRRARGDALGRPRGARVRLARPDLRARRRAPDYWRLARALFAAGSARGDLVHNCFAYHFTPAGSMLETGAHALGCTVFPGGIGQTEQQVQAMAELKADGYVGTPSFLKIILEKADELGVKLPCLTQGARVGEAFPAEPARRVRGARHRGLPGVCDGGPRHASRTRRRRARASSSTKACWSRSCARAPAIRSRRARSAKWSSRRSYNADYPLIRFGTGDLSAVPAGRLAVRAHERADQGMAGPRRPAHQGEGHVRRSVAGRGDRQAVSGDRARAARRRQSRTARPDDAARRGDADANASSRAEAIVESIRDVTKLRGDVAFHAPGELPTTAR